MANKVTDRDFLFLHSIAYNANSNIDPMFGASAIKELADKDGNIKVSTATFGGMIMDYSGDEIEGTMDNLHNPIFDK